MTYPELITVPEVDVNRYTGKWYEIASYPQRFQKGCRCTTAEYTVTDKGYITVFNQCRKGAGAEKISAIKGKAFPVKGSNNAKLKVQFFWPLKGDYWIIDLAPDYSYAVVGTENRKYLWILSRTPKMEQQVLDKIITAITSKGFNIDQLSFTKQDCENY
ncbi:MAG: lipocalin family protein [Chitinophagales bacterium]